MLILLKRFLAYKIFLNDVDEGGEMEFPQVGLKLNHSKVMW